MRKILQRLLSKLFIVSTIIIIQMIWWFFFVLYGVCCQQGVSGSAVCGSHITFALYCQQADENVYKDVMDIF